MVPLPPKQIYFKIEMPESPAKKVFRLQLSVSVVFLLLTLSALSLFASFYLGMIAGKSMQRPPETSAEEADSLAEEPMSAEDLKFFSLGERKKGQDLLDLEGIRDLKKKTEELTKVPEKPESTLPSKPKTSIPKISVPKSPVTEQKIISKKQDPAPKADVPESPEKVKIPVAKIKKAAAYTIQVFASRNHQNAKILVEKLKKSGFKEAFIFKHTAGSKTLYRVRVGKLERSETQKFANKLKKLKYIDSVQITRF
jgi:cell division septation protein DedD